MHVIQPVYIRARFDESTNIGLPPPFRPSNAFVP